MLNGPHYVPFLMCDYGLGNQSTLPNVKLGCRILLHNSSVLLESRCWRNSLHHVWSMIMIHDFSPLLLVCDQDWPPSHNHSTLPIEPSRSLGLIFPSKRVSIYDVFISTLPLNEGVNLHRPQLVSKEQKLVSWNNLWASLTGK